MHQEKRENRRRKRTKVGWTILNCKTPFKSDVFDVAQDALSVNGKDQSYAYVVRPRSVIIVPVTERGEIVTVRQYRYPIDEWCTEIPAGGTHDTGDEPLEQVAKDELREEVGGTAETWTEIGCFYTSPSLTSEQCYVFLAEKVRLEKKPAQENTEAIKIEPRPAADVLQLARDGRMETAPCALAVLMSEPFLRERGFLRA